MDMRILMQMEYSPLWTRVMHGLNVFDFQRTEYRRMTDQMGNLQERMFTIFLTMSYEERPGVWTTAPVEVRMTHDSKDLCKVRLFKRLPGDRRDLLFTSMGFTTFHRCGEVMRGLLNWLEAEGKVIV